nr:unnamed protein product [Callosobruchus analis]
MKVADNKPLSSMHAGTGIKVLRADMTPSERFSQELSGGAEYDSLSSSNTTFFLSPDPSDLSDKGLRGAECGSSPSSNIPSFIPPDPSDVSDKVCRSDIVSSYSKVDTLGAAHGSASSNSIPFFIPPDPGDLSDKVCRSGIVPSYICPKAVTSGAKYGPSFPIKVSETKVVDNEPLPDMHVGVGIEILSEGTIPFFIPPDPSGLSVNVRRPGIASFYICPKADASGAKDHLKLAINQERNIEVEASQLSLDLTCSYAKIEASKEDTTIVPQHCPKSKGIRIIQDIQIIASPQSAVSNCMTTKDTRKKDDNTTAAGSNEEITQSDEAKRSNPTGNEMESLDEIPNNDIIYAISDNEEQALGPSERITETAEAEISNQTGNEMESLDQAPNDDIIYAISDNEEQAPGRSEKVIKTAEAEISNRTGNEMESVDQAPNDDIIYAISDNEEQAPGPSEKILKTAEAEISNQTGNEMESLNQAPNDDIIYAISDNEEQAPGPSKKIIKTAEAEISNQTGNEMESLDQAPNDDIIYAISDNEEQAPGRSGKITKAEEAEKPNQTGNENKSLDEATNNDIIYAISDNEEQAPGPSEKITKTEEAGISNRTEQKLNETDGENNENPIYVSDSEEIPENKRPTFGTSPKGTKPEVTASETSEIDVNCKACKLSFPTEDSMRHHMSTMHAQFKCVHCQFMFFDEPSLKEHFLEKHKDLGTCVLCQAILDSSESLLGHHRTIHSDIIKEAKIWKCGKCNNSITTEEGMNVHMKRMHVVRGTSCTICLEGFPTTEEPSCSNCKLVCANESHLMLHYKKTHVDKDKSMTEEALDTSKVESLSVKAIQAKYAGNPRRKFECHICLARFKREISLGNHLKDSHDVEVFPEEDGQKWFICPRCEAKFETKELALEHVRRGHVEKFKCEKCMAYFRYELHLKKHEKSQCTYFWNDDVAERYCCRYVFVAKG